MIDMVDILLGMKQEMGAVTVESLDLLNQYL